MKGWAEFSTTTKGGPLRRSAEFLHTTRLRMRRNCPVTGGSADPDAVLAVERCGASTADEGLANVSDSTGRATNSARNMRGLTENRPGRIKSYNVPGQGQFLDSRAYDERKHEVLKLTSILGFLSLFAVLLFWSGSVAANPTESQARGLRNAFVRMSSGEAVTIVRNGPVALVARCDGGMGAVEFFSTSSEDNWFSNSSARSAGDEAVLCSGGVSGRFDQCEDGSALSRSGRYIGVSGDTSFGVDLLGSDCVGGGSATTTFDPRND
jgi:hypothetical protein